MAALAVSLVLYLAERGAECVVILHYFLSDQLLWAGWTLALLLPGCFIQVLSFLWYRSDGHSQCLTLSLVHFLQLGILKRHVDCFRSTSQCQGDNAELEKSLMKEGDLCVLRLLEALVQALPHSLLQVYIYLTLEHTDAYAVTSALASLLSLSWALVSYSRFLCLVKPGHLSMPWASLLCHLLWRMGMVGTRVMALAVFSRVYQFWVFAVAGAHWLVMSFWLVAQQTDVISNPCRWRLFNVFMGAVYVFCFINIKDGRSRYRVSIYYAIMLVENCVLLLLATDFLQEALGSIVKLTVTVMSGFFIGCAALIVFYTLLHPKSTEISQSFSKMAHVSRRARETSDEPALSSSVYWNSASVRETGKAFGNKELQKVHMAAENQESEAKNKELAIWMEFPNDHHHWMFLKLAMKTGNMSKISAAFLGMFAATECQPSLLHVDGKLQPPTFGTLECLGKMQTEKYVGSEGSPQEQSDYVTLENIRNEDMPETRAANGIPCEGGVGVADGGLVFGAQEEVDAASSPSSRSGVRDSATLYFSANMEGIAHTTKDSEPVPHLPDPGLKLHTDIKGDCGQGTAQKEELPVICVSPILSLAANSNFQRSIVLDVDSLGDESVLSEDDSETMENLLGKGGFHLLTTRGLPPSVRGRLIQEEKPCFTSTPKAQSTGLDIVLHADSKARRKLAQLTEKP
ncbi:XK-related 5 [Pelobates cultripes]|uniref:XK-related protein n=1 Tax=Pelobates cultripes TaxID=61616 RepID=A0AAD1R934_PELCU|nr:XK-related 5 [Pelobates cultripes]